jgi:4-amino-4-deoxy-L-arabinose transferase-like glycosyltransferase
VIRAAGKWLREARGASEARWVVGLTALAFVLRLAFSIAVQRRLEVFNDELFYHHAADTLSKGLGLRAAAGGVTAQWPPAFPFLLSLVYRVAGPKPLAGQVVNCALGALTVPLLYLLARRAFGRREATVAAVGLALLPGQILWNDVLIAETLYTFLLVAFFVLIAYLPRRPWVAVVLGVAVGLAALTRGEGLILIPAAIAVQWRALPRAQLLRWSAALVAAAVLTVAPWTIRNAHLTHTFIPISSNASITFYSGHNPRAEGAQNYAPPSLERGLPAFAPEREVAESKVLRHAALRFMAHHPGRELVLIPLKLLNLIRGDWHALEWVNAKLPGKPAPIRGRWQVPIRVLADATFYALLAATLASLALFGRALWRRDATRGVLVLFLAALFMYGFVYYGNFRYRAPLEPLMLLVAAPLLVRLRSSAAATAASSATAASTTSAGSAANRKRVRP